MLNFLKKNKPYIILVAVFLILTLGLITAPLFRGMLTNMLNVTSYTVWHNIFELSSIVISVCIFCVAYYSYEQNQNFRNLFWGSILLLMGFIGFFHTLSYKGMPDFLIPYTSSNRATTFGIIARLIEAAGILASTFIPVKLKAPINKVYFFVAPILISLLILNVVTYHPGLIPEMYNEVTGLTQIKIELEYIVIILLLFAVISLLRGYARTKDKHNIIFSCAVLAGIYSELSFTLYTDVYGVYNFLGHLLRFVMYFTIFRVIFVQNIKRPYLELSDARDEIKNYADNLDRVVEKRTEQINQINRKLLDDLEYARSIQMSMLPKALPNSEGVSFEACYCPADRVSGDFYNVFKIDDAKIGLYIGDVSGHGVSASMLTVFLNQSIKAKSENAPGMKKHHLPSEVLSNLYLDFNLTNFNSEVYLVVLYGIFDLETRMFTYSSAGLNVSPMIVSASGEISEIAIKGLPICKISDSYQAEYHDTVIELSPGDKMLFFTDGLTEAQSADSVIYSDARLKNLLSENCSLNAERLAAAIIGDLFGSAGDCQLKDDVTFLVMEVKK